MVKPEIAQYDADHIHEATTNSFLSPEGNNRRSAGVANFVDDTPLEGVNTIDFPRECVSPKIEELYPPKIEVEDVSNEDSNDEKPRGSYVNSEVLRRPHRDRHQNTYLIVTGQHGGYYEKGPLGQYKSI